MGAFIGIGALIDKIHSKGGAYLEGGAYWKEGAKSNHYGLHYSNYSYSGLISNERALKLFTKYQPK